MKIRNFSPAEESDLMTSINVTSLVDVTLVILIIFILIAPIMEQGISLTLPQATAEKIKTSEALTIEIDKLGRIHLDAMPVTILEFQKRLKAVASYNKDQPILIRADQDNKYGRVVQILDMLKQIGLSSVGILTRPREKD